MIGRFTDWSVDGGFWRFLVWLTVMMVVIGAPFLGLMVWLDHRARTACAAQHGVYTIVGSHWQTTYIQSGKVLVPIMQQVNDYACVGGR